MPWICDSSLISTAFMIDEVIDENTLPFQTKTAIIMTICTRVCTARIIGQEASTWK